MISQFCILLTIVFFSFRRFAFLAPFAKHRFFHNFGCPLAPFWRLLVPFWHPFGTLWFTFGAFWLHLSTLWILFCALCWRQLGSFLAPAWHLSGSMLFLLSQFPNYHFFPLNVHHFDLEKVWATKTFYELGFFFKCDVSTCPISREHAHTTACTRTGI